VVHLDDVHIVVAVDVPDSIAMMPDDPDTELEPEAPTVQGKLGAREPSSRATDPDAREPSVERPATAPASGLGRYDLGEMLGRGGMGEVYSARDEQIGREVAIKRLRNPSPQAITRFVREARIQGQLEHPAVVPVHELSRDGDGNPYFVMKQLTGITLSDILERLADGDPDTEKVFTRQRLLRAFCEVCIAVEFAHSRNIVHRDLKPANIMLGDFGEVHVLDWGIARTIDDDAPDSIDPSTGGDDQGAQTLAGAMIGTPGYMSTEQARGEAGIDARTDVYALGCILFEILTLETFHARGAPLVRLEPRPSVRAPARDIPPELDAICVTATQRERTDRYATARELGDAVQAYLDGDRDVALRKQLAGNELAAARSALAADDRPAAIRAAARALALDPANRESADLVARIMLEPPKAIPPEVEHAIAAVDLDALHASRKLIACGGFVFLAFVPLLLWIGFRDPAIIASAAVLGVIVGSLWFVPRHHIVLATRVAMIAIALAVALVARSMTPFLIAPGVAAIAGMAIATHPQIARPQLIIALFSAAVFVPWILELGDVISRTTSVTGNTIVLEAAAERVDATATLVVLSASGFLMVTLAIAFGAMLTATRRAAQRAIQVQTWQLGQLIPRAADSPSSP
jgi:serine/threonine-protein kinase